MATWGEYRARAVTNLALADRLAADGEYTWGLVLCFYSAVHCANGLMNRAGIVPEDSADHQRTKAFLRDNHAAIDNRYRSLLSVSWSARYLATYSADAERFSRYRAKAAAILDYFDRVGLGTVPGV